MKKSIKAMAIATACFGLTAMPVMAAPITLDDGSVFDPEFYAEANADVAASFGTSPEALYLHYLMFGEAEGRLPYGEFGDFDAVYYAQHNPDVVAVVGNAPGALYQHYVLTGQWEGRKGYEKDTTVSVYTASRTDEFLDDVYTLMSTGDFETVALTMDGSPAANAIADSLEEGECVLISNDKITDDFTGLAAGIYKLDYGAYYFFYGEYKNGVRSGLGASVWGGDDMQEVFVGTWADDAPNGSGVDTYYYDDYIAVLQGTFKDGYADGEMVFDVLEYEHTNNDGTVIENVVLEGRFMTSLGITDALIVAEGEHVSEDEVIYCRAFPFPEVQQGVKIDEYRYFYRNLEAALGALGYY